MELAILLIGTYQQIYVFFPRLIASWGMHIWLTPPCKFNDEQFLG